MGALEGGRIGVDESGKGDFFGPLVVAACYVGPEHVAELEGVADSKKLTDLTALRLAGRIKAVCPHKIVTILPPRYNEMYAEFKNLNHLLAWGHARAIEDVLEQHPADLVISDEFAKGGGVVKKALFERGKKVEFRSRVRAESDLAVAAASVLARAEFLIRLRQLGQEFGVDLPKGATNVIGPGRRLVASQGAAVLPKVAKMHFKTAGQVLAP